VKFYTRANSYTKKLLQTGKILKEYRILANNVKISIDGDAVADTLSIVDAAKY
jgi:hypothetical protein